ncbi:tRNA pseudouridine(38-40) synthase TruA [Micrococcus sp. KRD096]|uniref:tRNA pseudouridine synthase A n=1 Tax=Micrococcus sp. KRD096 TaxID=2729721 RepID=UPI0019D176CF|nr:tRNA pseudouridine(38-40) synthase TruA [Micrococcus sp. KRD096]
MSEQHRPDVPPAPGDPASVRVRLDLAYDGGAFHGWARQPGLDSVQGALEDGLERILRRPVRTVVAGRTDAGVHARGQVVHLDLTETEWAGLTRGRPGLEPATSLTRRLGGVLSGCVGFLFFFFLDVYKRQHWHGAALDDRLMALEADAVLGLHDFLSFCRPREGATTIREVQHLEVRRDEDGVVGIRIRADAFCHNMVRAIVGALLQVGEGAREPGWLAHRVARPARDSEVRLAPPGGLTLLAVGYPDEAEELRRRAEGTRAKRTL